MTLSEVGGSILRGWYYIVSKQELSPGGRQEVTAIRVSGKLILQRGRVL